MRELTIAAVEVETVSGPAGRFPHPARRQAQPLDVYRTPGEPGGPDDTGPEPDPDQIVEALYVRVTTRQGPYGLYGPVDPVAAWPLVQVLAPFLAGQDALAGAVLWDKMQRLDRHARHGHLKAGVRPAWLEEPFAPGQVSASAALRDKTTIPLAAGEHLYDRPELLPASPPAPAR